MKAELFNDHFQNFKRYQIPKAQLIIRLIEQNKLIKREIKQFGFAKSELEKSNPTLF
jgi:hypothetical protein